MAFNSEYDTRQHREHVNAFIGFENARADAQLEWEFHNPQHDAHVDARWLEDGNPTIDYDNLDWDAYDKANRDHILEALEELACPFG